MIKALIIDDEQLSRQLIKKYIDQLQKITLIGEAKDGFDGVQMITALKPDLIFLDIQMPKLNGFEMLELIEHRPKIIFTTAFDEYAIQAFSVSAIDYLLKPFSFERFHEAVEKALGAVHSDKEIGRLKSYYSSTVISDRIFVKSNSKINAIRAEDILYIEAQDDYIEIVTVEKKYLKKETIKSFISRLDPDKFVRTHRSYIINVEMLEDVQLLGKENYLTTIKGGHKLPASKAGYLALKEKMKL